MKVRELHSKNIFGKHFGVGEAYDGVAVLAQPCVASGIVVGVQVVAVAV